MHGGGRRRSAASSDKLSATASLLYNPGMLSLDLNL